MKSILRVCLAPVLFLCITMLAGCLRAPPEGAGPPVAVSVSYPVKRDVTDYAEYTCRTAAPETVEVRARVWGYLDKVNFKEGAMVKKDDILYVIDPRTYKFASEQAKAKVELDDANHRQAEADYQRIVEANKKNAVSPQELDKYLATRDAAAAALRADKAALETAKLNLEWTNVKAPISGRISRTLLTEGNFVQSGDQGGGSVLTSIVSVDPMWAYVDVDEGTVLRVRKMIREGKAKSARDVDLPVALGLANEDGFPHKGVVNFVDNQVNPKTGTLRLRGTFPNKDEVLSPGYFGKVRVPIGFSHHALLISDRAIDTDQGQRVVYVVGQDNKVASRPIRLGSLHDGLREITDGLKPDDRIIVIGVQQVRPGVTVEPTLVEMPVRSGVRSQESGASKDLKADS
ncbi:MAG TPA: efflux RND transporter periplasmic adaptor subunit [Gemmataceae bacterium]|nr:efflux RND transporter periplasmic adaptor subunit [Gemmataceae bacterium]